MGLPWGLRGLAGSSVPLDGRWWSGGFEIPFDRYLYVFQPPRLLEKIDRDLKACADRTK
jgi:type I restriction enzyme M protein